MSDLARCERHVGEVFPARCSDCDREQIIAASPVPDLVPDFFTDDELQADIATLVEAWKQTRHPSDAVRPVMDLANRTSLGRAFLATVGARDRWLDWLTWDVGTGDAITRLRILPTILSTIRQLSATTPTTQPGAHSADSKGNR